jgi:mono/diheme cytochrome c family protein
MAATDKTYRSQRTLDIVFAVSCVLMLVSIVWMFAADYNREFKQVQREYRDVDEALTERAMLEKLPDAGKVREASDAVEETRKKRDEVKAQTESAIRDLLTKKARQEAQAQSIKADYDSYMSLYNIAVDEREEGPAARLPALDRAVEERRKAVEEKEQALKDEQTLLDATNADIKAKETDLRSAEDNLSKAEDNLKRVSGEFDRFAKAVAQKRWKIGDSIRNLPVLDAFAAPVKIQQYTLAEYPIDYNFKYVTRYDRCTTCHLGMENASFSKEALRRLTQVPEGLQDKLDEARLLLQEQADKGVQLGFKVGDVPRTVRTTQLTDSQINEYCAHPRLDLFVEANSAHPGEKFGCTSCHSGQGSATDFLMASHTPNSSTQKHEWTREHGWEPNHFWDYPMLAKRFVESSCVKCHHQITDTVRFGNKIEAPKLLRGYNLVRESGCFGCHEIAGTKNGREIGPDLRLEPSPPLEAYTAAERVKMLTDPDNPPGTMRKVGPSLYRISEKTNQQWARRWVQSPRGFRPTTKMPHFYGLSNDSPDDLPPDQKAFPNTEIYGIVYYLFSESRDYMKGTDKYRAALEARLKELQEKKNANLASESELRLLEEITRRLELDKRPKPLAQEIRDEEGQVVQLPAMPQGQKEQDEQRKLGRQLFTERGCLACHQHQGTTKSEWPNVGNVASEANFGPDLSRVAAKIAPEDGGPEAKRRWLIQWILDPHRYFPRARMPVTHLNVNEAAAVAAWLFSQPAEGWNDSDDLPAPTTQALVDLTRVFLLKAPGMTRHDVEVILAPGDGEARKGMSDVQGLALDADERQLASPLTPDKMRWYIGRKAITRLGCFGCHDVPGFQTTKPIGTPLNDWGKKDPDRLAFEDIIAFVQKNHHMVDSLVDDKGHGPASVNGTEPYEQFFFYALEHHTREGFLNQKLREPRSYDYNRLRTWDDRLRMPQFKFARDSIKRLEGESEEQAEHRTEAEAREAVMTFILGLVAEPVPTQYVHDPSPDRLAEAKGRKVLEKYNCVGCHQVRAGLYELAKTTPVLSKLEDSFTAATSAPIWRSEYHTREFMEHNAWTGLPSPQADRLFAFGIPVPLPPDAEPGQQSIRLTQALQFVDSAKQTRNIPAAETLALATEEILAKSEPFGGVFANLMVASKYLTTKDPQKYTPMGNGESPEARATLPPPLLREGEKTQPAWLFQFLRHPFAIRPVTILRMPRFNMGDDEAADLVNYFAAADRLHNPGVGINYPYLDPMTQREVGFWKEKSQEYVHQLQEKKLVQKRIDELKPLLAILETEQTAAAEATLKAAREAEAREKDPEKKKAAEELRKEAEKKLAALKSGFAKHAQTEWESGEAYASDAYRLLASNERCLNCHQVGALAPKQAIGPPLDLAPQRLRSDWLLRWIGSPQRLLIYPSGQHPMPSNFPSDGPAWPEFAGPLLEQVTAVRDVLIDYPKVADMPVNRTYRPSLGGGGTK